MLKQLYIRNFTLIDHLDMMFYPGFSVITGETGAGKSIILGAISLLLGQRADVKFVKHGADKTVVEAHFSMDDATLQSFFSDNDIDYSPEDCILRRELSATGKSRSFINDTPVSLTLMRQLGQQLVDIHSQHKNLLLHEEDFQLNVLDIMAANHQALDNYQTAYKHYIHCQRMLHDLKDAQEAARREEDFLRFQYNELQEASLQEGQQDELEQEAEMMNHAEDIKSCLYDADNLLNADETGVVAKLKEATRAIESIKDVFPAINDTSERLDSSLIEVHDIAHDISHFMQQVEFDPQRQREVQDTLDVIYSLEKKHHVDTVEELIAIRNDLEIRIAHITNADSELAELTEQTSTALTECKQRAKTLTQTRHKAAAIVEREVIERLVNLGIPNVRFQVELQSKELSSDGADTVRFLFSANSKTPLLPISDVASGGEIARVMLALKAMISGAVKLPTIIFDEIDTGVSGKIAEKMALIMKEMGQQDRQVISITHLPQIAALGATHYKVYKNETPDGTTSSMQRLSDEERVQEIAQMLSGSNVTSAAISNARALLKM